MKQQTLSTREVANANYSLLVDIFVPIPLIGFFPLLKLFAILWTSPHNMTFSYVNILPWLRFVKVNYLMSSISILCLLSQVILFGTSLIWLMVVMTTCLLLWVPRVQDIIKVACEYVNFKFGSFNHSTTKPDGDGCIQPISREAFKNIVDSLQGSSTCIALFWPFMHFYFMLKFIF